MTDHEHGSADSDATHEPTVEEDIETLESVADDLDAIENELKRMDDPEPPDSPRA